jgi:hypothetical protein
MPTSIPSSWMPDAAMKRVHVHWTAGTHTANSTDKNSYHILVEGDGNLVRGDKSIAANAPGAPSSGHASHTKNANTGAIGISMCSMTGAIESPFSSGSHPLKEIQWDTMIKAVAQLAKRYDIPVTRQTVLTHAEVQPTLGIKQNNKWDINKLSFTNAFVGHYPIGDEMRRRIAIELDGLNPSMGGGLSSDLKLPRFRVKGVAPSTLNFRSSPGGDKVGELPENTLVERIAMQQAWWQVRTPKGHVGWVSSDFIVAVS